MDRVFPQSPPPEKNESGVMPPAGTGARSETDTGSVAQPINLPSQLQGQPSGVAPQPQPHYQPNSQSTPQAPLPTAPAGAQPANRHYTVTPVFPSYAQPSQLATSQLRQNLNPQAHALPAAPRSKSRLKLALIAGFALISLSVAGIYGFKMYSDYTYNQFVTDYEKASWAYMQEWTRGVKATSHLAATSSFTQEKLLPLRDELRAVDSSFSRDQASKLQSWQAIVKSMKKQTLWLTKDQHELVDQSDAALAELLSATEKFAGKIDLNVTISSATLQFVDDTYKLQDLVRARGINGINDIEFLAKYAKTEPYYENAEQLKREIPTGALILSNWQAAFGRIYIGYKKILQNDPSGLDDLRRIDEDSLFSQEQADQADAETDKIYTAEAYQNFIQPIQVLRSQLLNVTKERSKLGVSRFEAQALYYALNLEKIDNNRRYPQNNSFSDVLPKIEDKLNFKVGDISGFTYSSIDGKVINFSYKEDTTGRMQVIAEDVEAQAGGTKLEARDRDTITNQLEQSARILPRLNLPRMIGL